MAYPKDELVIEIDHPRNSPVYFHPANRELRSKFITSRGGGRPQAPLMVFTGDNAIPGQRVILNLKGRYAKIIDPLCDAENKPILELINRVNKNLNPPQGQNKGEDPIEHRHLTDHVSLSWLYYMMNLLEGSRVNLPDPREDGGLLYEKRPFAFLVAGRIPEEYPNMLELRQTGKILTFNPQKFRGESPFLEKLPDEEYARVQEALAAGV